MRVYADSNTPFDPAETQQPVVQDSQSTDESRRPQAPPDQKSGLRAAWDAWTSRPENNAALLQFGLNMMSPRAAGQSNLGHFAQAVGGGAEASGRSQELQKAEAYKEQEMGLKEQEAARKGQETEAYTEYMRRQANPVAGKGALSARIATQRSFNAWLSKPEDPLAATMGTQGDPIVQALQKQFPNIKNKGDILSNPQALGAARKLFETNLAEPNEETGAPNTPPAPAQAPAPGVPRAAVPPAQGQGRPVYDQATGAVKGTWYPDRGYVPNG
jgi:hypothetical protein